MAKISFRGTISASGCVMRVGMHVRVRSIQRLSLLVIVQRIGRTSIIFRDCTLAFREVLHLIVLATAGVTAVDNDIKDEGTKGGNAVYAH